MPRMARKMATNVATRRGSAIRDHVIDAVEALAMRGQRILVAVSGGVDSTVLLHLLTGLAEECGLELAVGHVNHGLRGEESDEDQRAIEALTASLALDCLCQGVDPALRMQGHPSRTRPTLQEAARAVRYEALDAMAVETLSDRIATAHILDDQVETVMMRLLRGCATDALGGIPESSPDGRIVRPLLAISRAEIVAYAEAEGLAWREDSSNANDAYTRNRLRNRWIPELAAEFNPKLVRAVGQLAEAHRRDAEWMAGLVAAEASRLFLQLDDETISITKQGWGELPEALARRLVQHAFHRLGAGRDLSRVHLERMLRFLREGPGARGGSEIELPGGIRLIREHKRLILHRTQVNDDAAC